MKSVIKAIIFLVMAFTVIFYGGALLLPGQARVERSITMSNERGRSIGTSRICLIRPGLAPIT